MRKFVVTLMASLLSCSAAFAFWPEAADTSLEIGVGYRQDRLDWKTRTRFDSGYSSFSDFSYGDSFGYNGNNGCFLQNNYVDGGPNRSRSHLKWKDINIWLVDIRGKYVTCDNIYLRANGDYGWITSGKNTDRDSFNFYGNNGNYYNNGFSYDDYFNGNGSDREFARSHSKVRGNVYDVRLAVGYQFKLCDDNFSIAPLVGYSWHGQHFRDRHLRQSFFSNDYGFNGNRARYYDTFSSTDVESYSYDYSSFSYGGNHSKYHTRWNGPFIGFDFDYRFGCACEWDIFGGYEFHWAEYHAKGRWNLREDLFDGFRHRAKNAYGHIFDIGIKWDFMECWTLALKGEFMWWWADRGHDRAKICRGNQGDLRTDCWLQIPLRHIEWNSAAVYVDVGMVF